MMQGRTNARRNRGKEGAWSLIRSWMSRRGWLLLLPLLVMGTLARAEDGVGVDSAASRAWADSNAYKLGLGDIININVYGEEDYKREKLRLSGNGMISFPFGDVQAVGKTLSQVEKSIESGLSQGYLVNPQVSVSIQEYRPFFIYGQVEKPGGYPFQPGLNVRKAVSLAGGFKERASKEKIFVVREGDAKNASQHIDLSGPVFPGDTVTVEESFF